VGTTTRFFRPGRPGDDVRSSGTEPLRMEVDGSALLSIEASASARRVKVGETLAFGASVVVTPPGASVRFTWDFGDGSGPRIGGHVSHRFTTPGPLLVVVRAEGSGGACAQTCTAEEEIAVEVTGQDREPDEPPGAPTGSGSTGGLGGTGLGGTGTGSGAGSGSGADGATATKPPPLRAERPEPDAPFSADPDSGKGKTIVRGVLISGSGTAIEGGLPKGAAGGSPKAAKGVPGTLDDPLQIAGSALLALAIVMLGALRERRRVRLRLA